MKNSVFHKYENDSLLERVAARERSQAKEDLRVIQRLLERTDFEKPESVDKLYRYLQTGKVQFQSSIGKRFDDEFYDYYQKGQTESENGNKAPHLQEQQVEYYLALELKKRENRRRVLVLLFAILSIASILYFALYYFLSYRSEQRMRQLSNFIGSQALSPVREETVEVHFDTQNREVPPVLKEYESLYNSNKRLIGWVRIDDTIIDYPVLQCDNNTYYLNHNFDQQEDRAGSIFLDYRCDVLGDCDNYIIYGHHMSSGKMFASLEKYESIQYYREHPQIVFDTIYEKQIFEVMYVFRSRVYNEEEVVFKYYDFIKANSEREFNSYMQEMEEMSFYDTGVSAVYGDQLLTLSTCDYEEENGRFVVVARRIR